jgi:sterol desaturase/sphingolipid hydroxylase (fatty acid hydroxylase superfamily)
MSPRLTNWTFIGQNRWVKHLLSPTMSAQAFFVDFYVYPVLSVLCLLVSIHDSGVLHAAVMALLGWFSWTLLEYVVHRVALHHLVWFRDLHAAHHADPRSYIGTPTPLSVVIFYLMGYVPASLVFGRADAAGWMAGLLAGYLSYVVAHWAVHHLNGNNVLLRRLKRQHAMHHHRAQDSNFGVTTAFWDRVFRTHHG